jgi:hypothetical protein
MREGVQWLRGEAVPLLEECRELEILVEILAMIGVLLTL